MFIIIQTKYCAYATNTIQIVYLETIKFDELSPYVDERKNTFSCIFQSIALGTCEMTFFVILTTENQVSHPYYEICSAYDFQHV